MIFLVNALSIDTISAIASLVAIIGGIAGFATLFIKDKGKQKQIGELALQTQEAQKQTFQMEKNNRILEKSLEFQMKVSNKEMEFMEIESKINKAIRDESIKPFIKQAQRGNTSNTKISNIYLKNFGNRAIEAKLIDNSVSPAKVIIGNFSNKFVENEVIDISIPHIKEGNKAVKPKYEFLLLMKDVDNNWYFQKIVGTGLSFKIEDPVKVELNDEGKPNIEAI